MLENLEILKKETQEKIEQYRNIDDVVLTEEFKTYFRNYRLQKSEEVVFNKYTGTIIKSPPNELRIYFSNSWFVVALIVMPYVNELYKYKQKFEDTLKSYIDSMEPNKNLKDNLTDLKNGNMPEDRKKELFEYIDKVIDDENSKSASYMKSFLTDYEWWAGSKTINRGDFFLSPALHLLNLVNVAQGYIGDIVDMYYEDKELYLLAEQLRIPVNEQSDFKGENLIVYGAPGTGKSKFLDNNYTNITRTVFHADISYYDFIGSYKPVPLYKEEQTVIKELDGTPIDKGVPVIDYQFKPGPFLEVLIKSLLDPNQKFTLLIEELNRANAPAVFGDTFQLLDRDRFGKSEYKIHPSEDVQNYLESIDEIKENIYDGLMIPSNMDIVATMNSADQGVFMLDSAFKRRWTFEYLEIEEDYFEHANKLISYNGENIEWKYILQSINTKMRDLNIVEDRHLGPYFVSPHEIDNQRKVKSKILIYLWDDVFRHERSHFFEPTIKTFSELINRFEHADVLKVEEFINDIKGN